MPGTGFCQECADPWRRAYPDYFRPYSAECGGQPLTAAAIGFNNAVLAEASMSYLGLGIQPPEPSLGRMLYEAQSYLFNAPWYAIGPGVTIILIILGFSMVSEGLRSMQQ